eukprot:205511_1
MVSNPSPGVYTFRSMHNKMITPVDIGTSEPQFEQHPMNYNSSTQQFEIQLSEDGDTYFIRSMETDQCWTVLSSTSLFDLTNGIGHLSLKPLQNGNEYQKFKFYPIERNKFHIESPVSGMYVDLYWDTQIIMYPYVWYANNHNQEWRLDRCNAVNSTTRTCGHNPFISDSDNVHVLLVLFVLMLMLLFVIVNYVVFRVVKHCCCDIASGNVNVTERTPLLVI